MKFDFREVRCPKCRAKGGRHDPRCEDAPGDKCVSGGRHDYERSDGRVGCRHCGHIPEMEPPGRYFEDEEA